jgi:hypothetical protein
MRPLINSFLDLGRRIERLPFPTLAAVHGTCIAGASRHPAEPRRGARPRPTRIRTCTATRPGGNKPC